jgi:hypothetical protein
VPRSASGYVTKPLERKNEQSFCIHAGAIAVSLGTTAMLDNSQPSYKLNASAEGRQQGDGAFRDGLYLGKLAAESGQLRHPAIAR